MRSAGSKGSHAGKHRAKPRVTLQRKFIAIVLLGSLAIGVTIGLQQIRKPVASAINPRTVGKPVSQVPHTLVELLALQPDELEDVDIGLMNLLCAEGLSGSESLDLTNYFARLDGIAKRVEFETKRHLYRF